MALHKDFPKDPYAILNPEIRWFPADEDLREKGFEKLTAKVPLKEMSSYSTTLSSLTGGRASFTMKYASYELVPMDVQDKLLKEYEATQLDKE